MIISIDDRFLEEDRLAKLSSMTGWNLDLTIGSIFSLWKYACVKQRTWIRRSEILGRFKSKKADVIESLVSCDYIRSVEGKGSTDLFEIPGSGDLYIALDSTTKRKVPIRGLESFQE